MTETVTPGTVLAALGVKLGILALYPLALLALGFFSEEEKEAVRKNLATTLIAIMNHCRR